MIELEIVFISQIYFMQKLIIPSMIIEIAITTMVVHPIPWKV